MEMLNQTQEEQNQLWGALGAPLRPSVLFKLSYLDIDENAFTDLSALLKSEFKWLEEIAEKHKLAGGSIINIVR
jgi:hypothetical protein